MDGEIEIKDRKEVREWARDAEKCAEGHEMLKMGSLAIYYSR